MKLPKLPVEIEINPRSHFVLINEEENTIKSKNIDKTSSNGISGFSLKSVQFKKEVIKKNQNDTTENQLENPFNLDDLMVHWSNYLNKIESEGNQNILAILKMDSPRITNKYNIEFNVANSINKVELNKELESMLPYLRSKLNNYKINFNTNIIEKPNKNIIYTTEEKYEKMKSINPAIKILKQTFDLDI
ncbi:MAG: hypothetical protein P8L83_01220 [Flavobacteriaceae bacterium]|nr:hypothetical protein [Flavobacteriaceae bacterium]